MRANSYGCVWHFQHRHAGDDKLELPLGCMFGAIVSDYDINSKIRRHCPMRNHHGYNSLTGRSAIADVQTSVRVPSLSARVTRPPHRMPVSCVRSQNMMQARLLEFTLLGKSHKKTDR